MTVLYNEIDPAACAWLRELIRAGAIAPGEVAECSIEDLDSGYIGRFDQFHAFAGIGVWSYALRLAGVPDDYPVWTGSCPCQPFSSAGRGKGFADKRHLWPAWFRLAEQCKPPVIFGEQVASPAGLGWLDHVSADLERAGYAFGAADLCAAGVGAPHIRQRLYWVADTGGQGNGGRGIQRSRQGNGAGSGAARQRPEGLRANGGLADADAQRSERRATATGHQERTGTGTSGGGAADSFWSDADWLHCRDGKWRPVEPGTFPLAHGAAARVGRLRGYGNAIVAPLAAAFIGAAL